MERKIFSSAESGTTETPSPQNSPRGNEKENYPYPTSLPTHYPTVNISPPVVNLHPPGQIPPTPAQEFESEVIRKKMLAHAGVKKAREVGYTWKAAQRAIAAVGKPWKDWGYDSQLFHNFYAEQAWSLSYVTKVTYLINKFGEFQARLSGNQGAYQKVEPPKGVTRQRIADQWHEQGRKNLSAEMNTRRLRAAQRKLAAPKYKWLAIAYYFGLRPNEVDALKEPDSCRIIVQDGVTMVQVYQKKLLALPRDKRWKSLPVLTGEQRALLPVIKSGAFERPSLYEVHKAVGRRVHLYAGRKGFCDLMLKKGFRLQDCSWWLGHTSTEITTKHYAQELSVKLAEIKQMRQATALLEQARNRR